jgi:hypothetical protein
MLLRVCVCARVVHVVCALCVLPVPCRFLSVRVCATVGPKGRLQEVRATVDWGCFPFFVLLSRRHRQSAAIACPPVCPFPLVLVPLCTPTVNSVLRPPRDRLILLTYVHMPSPPAVSLPPSSNLIWRTRGPTTHAHTHTLHCAVVPLLRRVASPTTTIPYYSSDLNLTGKEPAGQKSTQRTRRDKTRR